MKSEAPHGDNLQYLPDACSELGLVYASSTKSPTSRCRTPGKCEQSKTGDHGALKFKHGAFSWPKMWKKHHLAIKSLPTSIFYFIAGALLSLAIFGYDTSVQDTSLFAERQTDPEAYLKHFSGNLHERRNAITSEDSSVGVLVFAQGYSLRNNLDESFVSSQRIKSVHDGKLDVTLATDAESLRKFILRKNEDLQKEWKNYQDLLSRGISAEKPGELRFPWDRIMLIDREKLTTLDTMGLKLCEDCYGAKDFEKLKLFRGTKHDGKLKKIQSFALSPYRYTVFLDSDIYLCEPLWRYFDRLKRGDSHIILTNFHNSKDGFTANLSGIIPDEFTESNSGVVFYDSHAPQVKKLFNDTIHEYLHLLTLRPIPGDQPALRASLYRNRNEVAVGDLSKNEHCRFFWNVNRTDIHRNAQWNCSMVHGDARFRPEKKYIIPCRNEPQVVRTITER